jgi:hypothetical protein
MVLNHKCDAQIKIYQFCKFQKALFIKHLPNLTFHEKREVIKTLFPIKFKSNFTIRNECIYFNDYICTNICSTYFTYSSIF